MQAPRTEAFENGMMLASRYRIRRAIGQGGMGAIYEVEHHLLQRRFAVKLLRASALENPEILKRFEREAQIIAALHHPNIIEIFDFEHLPDGTPCIIMEYLEGEDLLKRLRRDGVYDWATIARVADQILSALAIAHAAGVVHRDLKPQNIFLAEDNEGGWNAKLLDFGISKSADAETALTQADRLLGTPSYMAPEQIKTSLAPVGPHTDLWAMGCILHEMASGKQAFPQSKPALAVLFRILDGRPERLLRPDAPPAFLAVLARALTHDARMRYQSAEEMRRDLRAALAEHVAAEDADAGATTSVHHTSRMEAWELADSPTLEPCHPTPPPARIEPAATLLPARVAAEEIDDDSPTLGANAIRFAAGVVIALFLSAFVAGLML